MRFTANQIRHFDLIPEVLARRVRFYRVPFLWAGGVTFRNTVLLRKGLGGSSDMLIAHELAHVQQFDQQGTYGFLRAYVADYMHRRIFQGQPHRVAYFWSSAERSARHIATEWAIRKGL